MPTTRSSRIISTLMIFVVMISACGGKTARKKIISTPTLFSQPTPPNTEPTQPALQSEATLGINLPTQTPPAGLLSTSAGLDYHYPPARSFNGQRPFHIGLLAGTEDPFFITLASGARQSAVNLDIELDTQFPQNWSSKEQIQLLDALLARGDLDALLLSSINPQGLIPSLQKAVDAGVFIIPIQTSLADAPGLTPLFTIRTDNHLGGFLACQALANSLVASEDGNEKTPTPPKRVYIQKGGASLLDPDAREKGCQEALTQVEHVELAGIDSHEGDPLKASQKILAIIASEPELAAIFCTDVICAQAAAQALASQGLSGKIIIAAMDADPEAVSLLQQGSIDILATPKPYDIGYLAVAMTAAALDGVTSLPASLSTGWAVISRPDLDNPATVRWLYKTEAGSPQRSSTGLQMAFVAGIDDPFYYNMQRGAQLAAASLGVDLQTQFPRDWSAAEQAQIIDTLSTKNKLAGLLLVPTDPLALLPSLQNLANTNIPVLTLDTSLDASFTPLSALSSNHQDGGYFACRSLALATGGHGKFYIQSVSPGIPTTDARERGCQLALQEFPEITLIATNYNDDDPAKAQAQLGTILQNYPDLSAVFCTNVLGAQAVGQYLGSQGLSGKVKVAAFDATSATIDLLRSGVIDMVVAQEPADMGYLAVLFAAARLDGLIDLPTHLSTGFVLLTRENMDDPAYTRYFYTK